MYLCLSFCDFVFLLVLLYNAKLILCTLCLPTFVFFDLQKMQVNAWEEGKMEANHTIILYLVEIFSCICYNQIYNRDICSELIKLLNNANLFN